MLKKIKTHLRCKYCHNIFFFKEIYFRRIELLICPRCNKKKSLSIWPSQEIIELLDYISMFNSKSKHFKEMSIVFLCSILELLLESTLVMMIWQELMPEAFIIVDNMLNGYQGRNRLLLLYNKMGYGSFKEHLKEINKSEFLKNWDLIVEERNKIVHGKLGIYKSYFNKNITHCLIRKQVKLSLEVFALLNNYLLEKHLDRNLV